MLNKSTFGLPSTTLILAITKTLLLPRFPGGKAAANDDEVAAQTNGAEYADGVAHGSDKLLAT